MASKKPTCPGAARRAKTDDLVILVRSPKAAERVLKSVSRCITGKLKLKVNELNAWIIRRLKACLWSQWKLPRTKVTNLKKLGIKHKEACKLGNTRKGRWRVSKHQQMNYAMPKKMFTQKRGLVLLG